jgi:hypothetical protein
MRSKTRSKTRRLLLLAAALAGCDGISTPRVPQIDQAREAVEAGGDRYRAHRACTNTARTADALVQCMDDAGWRFLVRGPGYPESDCWRARDRDDVANIPSICFERGAGRETR